MEQGTDAKAKVEAICTGGHSGDPRQVAAMCARHAVKLYLDQVSCEVKAKSAQRLNACLRCAVGHLFICLLHHSFTVFPDYLLVSTSKCKISGRPKRQFDDKAKRHGCLRDSIGVRT